MSGTKALLDTNVIIFASKRQIDLPRLLSSYDFFYTSIISFMEVYGHAFTRQEEKDLVDELFENLEISYYYYTTVVIKFYKKKLFNNN